MSHDRNSVFRVSNSVLIPNNKGTIDLTPAALQHQAPAKKGNASVLRRAATGSSAASSPAAASPAADLSAAASPTAGLPAARPSTAGSTTHRGLLLGSTPDQKTDAKSTPVNSDAHASRPQIELFQADGKPAATGSTRHGNGLSLASGLLDEKNAAAIEIEKMRQENGRKHRKLLAEIKQEEAAKAKENKPTNTGPAPVATSPASLPVPDSKRSATSSSAARSNTNTASTSSSRVANTAGAARTSSTRTVPPTQPSHATTPSTTVEEKKSADGHHTPVTALLNEDARQTENLGTHQSNTESKGTSETHQDTHKEPRQPDRVVHYIDNFIHVNPLTTPVQSATDIYDWIYSKRTNHNEDSAIFQQLASFGRFISGFITFLFLPALLPVYVPSILNFFSQNTPQQDNAQQKPPTPPFVNSITAIINRITKNEPIQWKSFAITFAATLAMILFCYMGGMAVTVKCIAWVFSFIPYVGNTIGTIVATMWGLIGSLLGGTTIVVPGAPAWLAAITDFVRMCITPLGNLLGNADKITAVLNYLVAFISIPLALSVSAWALTLTLGLIVAPVLKYTLVATRFACEKGLPPLGNFIVASLQLIAKGMVSFWNDTYVSTKMGTVFAIGIGIIAFFIEAPAVIAASIIAGTVFGLARILEKNSVNNSPAHAVIASASTSASSPSSASASTTEAAPAPAAKSTMGTDARVQSSMTAAKTVRASRYGAWTKSKQHDAAAPDSTSLTNPHIPRMSVKMQRQKWKLNQTRAQTATSKERVKKSERLFGR